MSEFDLIARYFTRPDRGHPSVLLGVGDDCALLRPVRLQQAISMDMLVEGRHFLPGADPVALGHKCLAVNLSDLAAMGARPIAFTLALALPAIDESWLQGFSAGLFALADQHDCALIGGDTTKGPLTICITVFGELVTAGALLRSAARAGDDIWVSGTLGDARLALAYRLGELKLDASTLAQCTPRMDRPTPRNALGIALVGVAHAAIDISDGLGGDLGHILTCSGAGATIDVDALPAGPALASQSIALRRAYCVAGGDDYELCFTAPRANRQAVLDAGRDTHTNVTRIGSIDPLPGLRLTDRSGIALDLNTPSFDHFTTP
ncbi:thiamine-phosphate kinase [Actimicrobium sp. CCC2.4]|uniref:thiamine-phosphate kinase n=1 Tax=Actimicrobium sp. CCC2.4 TaxID=3048606 RepID=UPI002AC97296|nr:thiamine-phosphate kinase [Actimicrobium sp. CCC2.4]MEB0137381.1 thiamine-phosphate kinase [Actimicrobium sp. CCC2.4]WPX31808.1 thiamine-phosphate kinase [Actimicrobium sp. CCC2.4]